MSYPSELLHLSNGNFGGWFVMFVVCDVSHHIKQWVPSLNPPWHTYVQKQGNLVLSYETQEDCTVSCTVQRGAGGIQESSAETALLVL
jgi:hypothetical protein